MVHIGKHYRPSRFETRSSDGQYVALNPPMDRDAMRVQQSYLGERRKSLTLLDAAYALLVVGALALVVLL